MKKMISMVLALVMLFSLTACGEKKADDNGGMKETTALEVLEKVWESYEEGEKFPIMGGDMANVTDNKPGAFHLDDTASLDSVLHVSEDLAAKIDNAASMVHMMNANTFTCGAYALKEGTEAESFASDLKASIQATQWMCGFPQILIIAKVSDQHVVAVFGEEDLTETFMTKLTDAYKNTEIIYQGAAEA